MLSHAAAAPAEFLFVASETTGRFHQSGGPPLRGEWWRHMNDGHSLQWRAVRYQPITIKLVGDGAVSASRPVYASPSA